MREIKFRIWDVVNKIMIPSEQAVWTGVNITTADGRDYSVPLFSVAFIDVNSIKLSAQQYSTVKDKNGKEIYEGDFIKYRGRIGIVEFFAGMFICSWGDQTDDELSYMTTNDMEVIGNMSQNPELSVQLTSQPEIKEEEEENEDLARCEQCNEHAWDGYICHACGMKII